MNAAATRERGSVLIVALWAVFFLAAAAIAVSRLVVTDRRLAQNEWEEMRSTEGARSAILSALRTVRGLKSQGWDAYNQPWANAPELFQSRGIPEGRYGLTHEADGVVLAGLSDESGKIDINLASGDVVERLFGGAPGVAAAVLDWRDADDVERPGGAEAAHYRIVGPRNGPFRSVMELLLVRGMSPDLFKKVRPLMTVAGGPAININTAPVRVLAILGLPPRLVDRVKVFRDGPDGRWGTPDDGVFRGPGEIAQNLSGPRSPDEEKALAALLQDNRLSTRSRAVGLNMVVTMADGYERRLWVVARPRSWPPHIFEWRENPW